MMEDASTPESVLEDVVRAIKEGDDLRLVELWKEWSFSDEESNFFLNTAGRVGNIEQVKYFLSRGTSVTPSNVRAAFQNPGSKIEVFQEFVNHGWDVNTSLPEGFTPIYYAVEDEELLHWFLDRGADPGIEESLGDYSPTYTAAMFSSTSRLELLLSYGAKLDLMALFGAMTKGGGISSMKLLVAYGIDVNGIGNWRGQLGRYNPKSPLHCAVGLNRKDYVQFLLENGAKSERKEFGEYTPAVLALKKGYTDILELISDWPSDPS